MGSWQQAGPTMLSTAASALPPSKVQTRLLSHDARTLWEASDLLLHKRSPHTTYDILISLSLVQHPTVCKTPLDTWLYLTLLYTNLIRVSDYHEPSGNSGCTEVLQNVQSRKPCSIILWRISVYLTTEKNYKIVCTVWTHLCKKKYGYGYICVEIALFVYLYSHTQIFFVEHYFYVICYIFITLILHNIL